MTATSAPTQKVSHCTHPYPSKTKGKGGEGNPKPLLTTGASEKGKCAFIRVLWIDVTTEPGRGEEKTGAIAILESPYTKKTKRSRKEASANPDRSR